MILTLSCGRRLFLLTWVKLGSSYEICSIQIVDARNQQHVRLMQLDTACNKHNQSNQAAPRQQPTTIRNFGLYHHDPLQLCQGLYML